MDIRIYEMPQVIVNQPNIQVKKEKNETPDEEDTRYILPVEKVDNKGHIDLKI